MVFDELGSRRDAHDLEVGLVQQTSLCDKIHDDRHFCFKIIEEIVHALDIFKRQVDNSGLKHDADAIFTISDHQFRFGKLFFADRINHLVNQRENRLIDVLEHVFFLIGQNRFVPISLIFNFFNKVLDFNLHDFTS